MDERIDKIIDALKQVYDPEIPVNIYDLGLIYSVDVDEKSIAQIAMTLTAPGCPAADMILSDVTYVTKQIEGIEDCQTDLTFDPPWDKSMMSEDARLELGFM